ncbi:protein I'm not dead yet-like [Varroa destructor]|uniref:Uncharacterized protein n=1 Tax=Varroa destructor TaxID=109461 RepID=A0A7M7KGX1_VARDE|nr:protein I'm not dead yet-like [Varroa destructor]
MVVVILMSLFWMTEAISLAVIALIPLAFFPLFGILRGVDMGRAYFGDTASMFLGSLIAAAAVQYSNLHYRIAFRAILATGITSKKYEFANIKHCFICALFRNCHLTLFRAASFQHETQHVYTRLERNHSIGRYPDNNCISLNVYAATVILMVPIIEGILHQLRLHQAGCDTEKSSSSEMYKRHFGSQGQKARLRRALYLGASYAANIGGTGSLTESPPNLILKAFTEQFVSPKLIDMFGLLYYH